MPQGTSMIVLCSRTIFPNRSAGQHDTVTTDGVKTALIGPSRYTGGITETNSVSTTTTTYALLQHWLSCVCERFQKMVFNTNIWNHNRKKKVCCLRVISRSRTVDRAR